MTNSIDYANATTLDRLKALDELLGSKNLRVDFIKEKSEVLSDTVTRNHYTGVIYENFYKGHQKQESFPYYCPVGTLSSGKLKPSELAIIDEDFVPQWFDRKSSYKLVTEHRADLYVGFFYCLASDFFFLEDEGIDDVADYIEHHCHDLKDVRQAMKTYSDLIEQRKKLKTVLGASAMEAIREITQGY